MRREKYIGNLACCRVSDCNETRYEHITRWKYSTRKGKEDEDEDEDMEKQRGWSETRPVACNSIYWCMQQQ